MGEWARFDTNDSQLWHRIGHRCKIVRRLAGHGIERDEEVGEMFRVRFRDGEEIDAFEDELTVEKGLARFAVAQGPCRHTVYGDDDVGVAIKNAGSLASRNTKGWSGGTAMVYDNETDYPIIAFHDAKKVTLFDPKLIAVFLAGAAWLAEESLTFDYA